MSIRQFTITATFVKPRTQERYEETCGPIYGIDAMNKMLRLLLSKRNCVGVISTDVTPRKSTPKLKDVTDDGIGRVYC